MLERQKLTYHDFWIRLIGYGFLIVGGGVCIAALLIGAAELTGAEVIDQNTGHPASTGRTLTFVGLLIAGSLPFILLGRWITGHYRKGRRSGL